MPGRIRVIYVAGLGRSGSTVLGELLGQAAQRRCVGELRYFWQRGLVENRLCGDGIAFADHPFWRPVVARYQADGLSDYGPLLAAERRAMSSLRQLPRLALGLPPRSDAGIARYVEQLRRMYCALGAIAQQQGCSEIVDSSKNPLYGWWLSRVPEIDLHVVHLVRDPRAVAWSRRRRKQQPDRAGMKNSRQHLNSHSMLKSVLHWRLAHAATAALQQHAASYRVLQYEAWMQAPRRQLLALESALGSSGSEHAFCGDAEILLQPGLAFAGNPSRFKNGTIRLQPDDEWQHAMPAHTRRLLALLAGPQLQRYGYR